MRCDVFPSTLARPIWWAALGVESTTEPAPVDRPRPALQQSRDVPGRLQEQSDGGSAALVPAITGCPASQAPPSAAPAGNSAATSIDIVAASPVSREENIGLHFPDLRVVRVWAEPTKSQDLAEVGRTRFVTDRLVEAGCSSCRERDELGAGRIDLTLELGHELRTETLSS